MGELWFGESSTVALAKAELCASVKLGGGSVRVYERYRGYKLGIYRRLCGSIYIYT